MKDCVSSVVKDIHAKVDEHFGRAAYFIFIDTETDEVKAISNTSFVSWRGAGISAARIVTDEGAEAVLTGLVGPNAFEAMKASGIRIFEGISNSEEKS